MGFTDLVLDYDPKVSEERGVYMRTYLVRRVSIENLSRFGIPGTLCGVFKIKLSR